MVTLRDFESVAEGLDHPEGVAWGPDGHIYAGGEAGQIYRISAEGNPDVVASTGGFMYGVALDRDGNVFACDFGTASVVRVSATGDIETISTGTPDRPMRVPNFAAFDDGGALFVTDSGEWGDDDGLIFRIGADGETTVWTDEISQFPNGCCLSADGSELYVVESHGRTIDRVPIADDESPGPISVFVELPGSQPDGIALAEDGTLFVGCYRPDRIYRVEPDGRIEILAEDADGVVLNQPTNVAFIGPELDRLAVSSLGGWSIVAADVGAKGVPLRYPRSS
jgi:gluconolactonase